MEKRGDSQVDWVIAASIFVIFLSYFFLLAKPLFTTDEKDGGTIALLEESLKKDLLWKVDLIPLLGKSDKGYTLYPLRAKLPSGTINAALSDNTTSYIDRGYFFAVKPLSGRSVTYVASSNSTYEERYGNFGLLASAGNVTSYDLNVALESNIVSKANHKGVERISSFRMFADGRRVLPEISGFSDRKLLSRHHIKFGYLNSTTYIYAGAPIIDQRIDTDYSASVNARFEGYYMFYADSALNGNTTGCFYRDTDSLILRSLDSGVLIRLDERAPISFCMNPDLSVDVNISVERKKEFWIRYAFFTGNLTEGLAQRNITTFFGIPKTVEGVSSEKLALLNMSSYSLLKKEWNYPAGRDFRIIVLNSSTEIGGSIPDTDIRAKEIATYSLDRFGNRRDLKVSVQTW